MHSHSDTDGKLATFQTSYKYCTNFKLFGEHSVRNRGIVLAVIAQHLLTSFTERSVLMVGTNLFISLI